MGVIVALEAMELDELELLANLNVTSDAARRFRRQASVEWHRATRPFAERVTGRWAPLVWFTQTERIMEPDELAAALCKYAVVE